MHIAAAEHALPVLLLLQPKYRKYCKDKEFGKEGITASHSVMEQLLLALSEGIALKALPGRNSIFWSLGNRIFLKKEKTQKEKKEEKRNSHRVIKSLGLDESLTSGPGGNEGSVAGLTP